MLNLSNNLSSFYWDNHIMFLLYFINVWVIAIDFWMLNQSCILGISPLWLWYIIFFMYCLDWFVNVLFRIFAFVFTKRLVSSFPFLKCPYQVLVSWLCWPHKTTWIVIPPFFFPPFLSLFTKSSFVISVLFHP